MTGITLTKNRSGLIIWFPFSILLAFGVISLIGGNQAWLWEAAFLTSITVTVIFSGMAKIASP